MKNVIDATTMQSIEEFEIKDTQAVTQKYQSLGTYDNVSVDRDGDIILINF